MATPRSDDLVLAAPPAAPAAGGGATGVMQVMLPALGGLGTVLFVVANRNPLFLLAGVALCVTTVGGAVAMLVARRSGSRRTATQARARYLAYLERQRTELGSAAGDQRRYAERVHPDPALLSQLIRDRARLYERRVGDADHLRLRVGIGAVPPMLTASKPVSQSPLTSNDGVCERAVDALLATHQLLGDHPVVVPLESCSVLSIVGPATDARDLARAVLAQLVAQHTPDDVRVAVCAPGATGEWDWLKWLPHVQDPRQLDGAIPRRCAATGWAELRHDLADDLAARAAFVARTGSAGAAPRQRLVIILDQLAGGPQETVDPGIVGGSLAGAGVHVIALVATRSDEGEEVDIRLTLDGATTTVDTPGCGNGRKLPSVAGVVGSGRFTADRLDRPAATVLARALARAGRPVDQVGSADPFTSSPALAALIDVAGSSDDDAAPRPVPLGVRPDGSPLLLDLKESGRGGMGPHGVCVGATGSGKSELVRTLVLGLAMTHSTDELAVVLVDYKGGATFAGLQELPHCAGSITNLSDDLGLVDRMRDALTGEMTRRQRILLEAGNCPNLAAYTARRRADPALPVLPTLVIVVDEFAELLTAKPDFIDLFTGIGRIGRSIGVHLVLASQRLDEGRLRGLDSYLSYRIGLRTFTAEESRAVLGVTDAFTLPPTPGAGYLKVDTTVFERFDAAYVSGPVAAPAPVPTGPHHAVVPFTLLNSLAPPEIVAAPQVADPVGESVLDATVARLRGAAEPVHQVWLPSLPERLDLDDLLVRDVRPHATGPGWSATRIAVGVVDRPAEQRREPLVVDLASAAGHLAVLGAPRSGKTTLVRTLITSSARHAGDAAIGWHCVDFGGGGLDGLQRLAPVGTVAGRLDLDRVRRVFASIRSELDRRERVFAEHAISGADDLRARWNDARPPGLNVADLVLVVDNYAALRTDHDDLHDALVEIAVRGLALGIHVVLTAARFHDLRPALQSAITGRIELRLADPADSVVDRRRSVQIGSNEAGRALADGGHLAQIAVPDAIISTGSPDGGFAPVPTLPLLLGSSDMDTSTVDERRAGPAIGLDEADLAPVTWRMFDADQHLIVIGDHGAGRTTLIRQVIGRASANMTTDEVVFALIDPRRTLMGEIPEDYLGGYAPTSAAASSLVSSLSTELRRRLPGEDVTPAQLRSRSWWSGPEIVLIVDDYDLLGGGSNPLDGVDELLPHARDIGLHIMVSRHSGGASRAFYEPFLQRLRDMGATGLVLSAEGDDAPLWPGVRPVSRPPGRGVLIRRGEALQTVQLAHQPPLDQVTGALLPA